MRRLLATHPVPIAKEAQLILLLQQSLDLVATV